MVPAAVLLVVTAACGSGSGSGQTASGAGALTALLKIISTNIQTAEKGGKFVKAKAGSRLGVGAQVKTDPTGFAELTYHDGSWQRVENNATLTIAKLTDTKKGKQVRTSVDVGRTWNRVRELTEPDDAYEVDTPVATATVRGTKFSTDCADTTVCEFSVVEGTVRVTPTGGTAIDVVAPGRLEVRLNQPPGTPQAVAPDALAADPWIAKNLDLDTKKAADPSNKDTETASGTATPAQLTAASIVGEYDGTRTGVSTNLPADFPNRTEPGKVLARHYVVTADCTSGTCKTMLQVTGDALPPIGPDNTPGELPFGATGYTSSTTQPLDCIDDQTKKVVVPGAVNETTTSTYTPGTAVRGPDGRWVVTKMTAQVEVSVQVVKQGEWDAQNCKWDTSDGQPYHQLTKSEMTRTTPVTTPANSKSKATTTTAKGQS